MIGIGKALRIVFTVAALGLTLPVGAEAQQYDPLAAWPLCGRIVENAPNGWTLGDDCPADRFGDANHTDWPINSTFGPRPLNSAGDRYDFHRGIDLSTPTGTPLFAIAAGEVQKAGQDSAFDDPVVVIRHMRPGETSCGDLGCYHSAYLHMSSVVVAVDDIVEKGQLIGYSGASASGYEHLHFEIRDAVPEDPTSSWQRDAVHPLLALPYEDGDGVAISFDAVDTSTPNAPVVDLSIQTPRRDVTRVELVLLDLAGEEIPQPGNTPDPRGYNVLPSFFDVNVWNRQYTHKDSSNFPWESFDVGGANECPYAADHGANYSAHVHMDRQDPGDPMLGLFNGIRLDPFDHDQEGDYRLGLRFLALDGAAACIRATVTTADGGAHVAEWGECDGAAKRIALISAILSFLLDE